MKKNIFLIDTIAVVCFNLAVVYGQTAHALRPEEQAAAARQILQQYEMAMRAEVEQPIKCGFTAAALLQADPSLAAQFPALAKAMLLRPTLPFSYTTPSGRFKFHYTLTGANAVNSASTIAPPVPDFVYEAGLAAERAYHLLIDSLGFAPHASDNGADGPELDFYFQNYLTYGATFPEFSGGQTHSSAYIIIENDFAGLFTTGVQALRVTVAHEYFHAVQLSIRNIGGDSFFFEMSSTWFEDVAYDDVNDYLAYLRHESRENREPFYGLLQRLHLPLSTANGWHEYGACLWLHYAVKKLGKEKFRYRSNIIYDIWQRSAQEPALAAMKTVLEAEPYTTPFSQAFSEFNAWCYFTGPRADAVRYFEEGANYPQIKFNNTITMSLDSTISGGLSSLAANFYRVIRKPQNIQAFLQTDEPGRWMVTAISKNIQQQYVLSSGVEKTPITVETSGREDTVAVAVVNTSLPSSSGQSFFSNYQLQFNSGTKLQIADLLEKPRPNPFRGRGTVYFPFRLSQGAPVEAAILREDGRVMHSFKRRQLVPGVYPFELSWDGLDDSRNRVGSGVYFLLLRAGDFQAMTKFVVIN